MKVLLLQNIKGLGQKMDIREVREGYARNFLFPRKIAVVATDNALRHKKATEQRIESIRIQHQVMAEKLRKEVLKFVVKTGKKDEIFEPINEKKIKNFLESKGYVDFEVVLPQSLKAMGEHKVEIKLPHGVESEVVVILESQR